MTRRRRTEDDDDIIVPDGGSVRVRMPMMDSLQRSIAEFDAQRRVTVDYRDHRPGFVRVDSPEVRDARAKALQARREMIDRAASAWKSLGRDAASVKVPGRNLENPRDAANAEYDAMCRRLTDAWRGPRHLGGHDAAQPDLGSRLSDIEETPDDNAQARRDRAYQSYCDRIGSAWKTNPAAGANTVEQQRRGWTHEGSR